MDKIKVYQPVIEGSSGPQTNSLVDCVNEIAFDMIEKSEKKGWNTQTQLLLVDALIKAFDIENVDMTFDTKIVNMFDMKYVIIIKKMTRKEYDSLPEFDSY